MLRPRSASAPHQRRLNRLSLPRARPELWSRATGGRSTPTRWACKPTYTPSHLSELRYDWTNVPDSSFYASLNHFHHKKALANHINYTSGGSPNQDSLYSWGWLDLREGLVIVAHPEVGDRYFTFEIADIFSDNFAYVGKRTTGGAAGAFAILPPGWSGSLPPNIKASFQSPTRFALVFGRILVSDEGDAAAVNSLQEKCHMIPRALWG